jgi:hypothetical protein
MLGPELFDKIKQVSTFSELLHSVNGKTPSETQSKRGNLYEKMWDCIIKFGFYHLLSNDKYDHYQGNINTCKLKKVDNLETYLHNLSVFSKGAGGSSDITLQNRNTNKWIFISSKFYLDDSKKSIYNYDVEKILAITKQHAYKYKEFDIYLIVHDKQKVSDIISSCQSTNNYIKENIRQILDLSDLEECIQIFKKSIQNISFSEINSKYCNTKIPLELRFHQDLLTYKQIEKIEQGKKELLLGAKARSGKTYCVGGLFIKYYKKYTCLNALIITPAPNETLSQFTDDLFGKFGNFIGINIIEIKKGSDFENLILQENNIIIVSKQLLDDYVLESKIINIQQLYLDFIVFDENHFHGTTQMSKNILRSYSSQKTIKLFLTATYAKPLNEWNIPEDCQFYWDIEDEQLCKKRNINGLIEKHGKEVLLFLTEENKETKLCVYDKMPDLELITNIMDMKRYQDIKEKIKDTSYGFSNSTLLSGNFPNEVDTILKYITGSNKEEDYSEKDLSIFGRIRRKSVVSNSRTKLNNGDFTSQLWFLPFGINMAINDVSEHMKDRMLKNKILKNYEIKIVNSKKEYKLKDIKEEIKHWEIKAKEEGKDGLILLAGNQLTLGITLPFVDIVFLFNDIVSSDRIIQMMYRCMTESINNTENNKINHGIKKIGFVVDLNISRVLNTLLDYNVHKKDLNVEDKIRYMVENNLINIDSDLFDSKENKTKLVEKLLHIWKSDPVNNLKILLRKIEDNIIVLDTNDQKTLNHYFTSSARDENINIKIQFDESCDQALPDGKKIIKDSISEDSCGSQESEKTEEDHILDEINISLTKDVLPFIIPLSCILTINTEDKDILEMLNVIKSQPSLLNVFHDQSFIWWSKKDIIGLMEKIVEKYVKKNSFIYNIAIQFKMSLQCLIDKPKELLELIDSCLKPKKIEKEQFGEVFTPMYLVFEMLDNLDKYYTAEHGVSIFTNKHLKWFDPASGMGNFPVAIYLKLMDGLQIEIPNYGQRKKHVLENMLYMSEINKKNVFICHEIFNINNEYKLNLHEGNSFELNTENIWGIKKFDIVLGNPPYNKSKDGTLKGGYGGRSLWDLFVVKSFDDWVKEHGYLVFIHPPSWRKPQHYLWNILGKKQILYLKTYSKKEGNKIFGCSTLIDYYILKNTNIYKETLVDAQDGEHYSIHLSDWNFLPSGVFETIKQMLGKNNVLYSSSIYDTRRPYVSKSKTEKHNLPVVHNMTKKEGLGFVYSSEDKGHFGISKVILSFGEFQYPYNDWNGEYGMSQICYGIKINSKEEGDKIVDAINSEKFKEVLKYTKWSTFQTDWRMFNEFKPDFWKLFVSDSEEIEIVDKIMVNSSNETVNDNTTEKNEIITQPSVVNEKKQKTKNNGNTKRKLVIVEEFA